MTEENLKSFTVGGWAVTPALNRLNRLDRDDASLSVEPRVMNVLVYLAQRPGQVVTFDELIAEVWHRSIVDDSPIYQTVAQLRRALGDDAHHPRYIETIAKKGYRLIADVRFETQRPTIRAVKRSSIGGSKISPVLAILLAGTYLFLGGSDVASRVASDGISSVGLKSIAVLPFADMSADGSQEYLAHGIADELIHALSNVPDLRVAARTSSFRVSDRDIDIPEIGGQLNVATILEGSIRSFDDRVRVTAQLVNADDGYHLWSKSFEGDKEELLTIQKHIVLAVADSLDLHAPGLDLASTQEKLADFDAYEYYLLGQHHLRHRTKPGLERSIAYFEKAVERDPENSRAYAGLAIAHTLYQFYWQDPDDFTRARFAAERALEINSEEAEAYAAFGLMFQNEGGWRDSKVAFERAVAINPNYAQAYTWYAILLGYMERRDESRLALEKALALDPLSAQTLFNLAQYHTFVGRSDIARDYFRRAHEADPEFRLPYMVQAVYELRDGRFPSAIRVMQKYESNRNSNETHWISAKIFAWCYRAIDEYATAQFWIDKLADLDAPEWIIPREHTAMAIAGDNYDAAGEILHDPANEQLNSRQWLNHRALLEMMIGHDDHAFVLYKKIEDLPHHPVDGSYLFNIDELELSYLPPINLAHLYLKKGNDDHAQDLLSQSRVFANKGLGENNRAFNGHAYYLLASIQAVEGDADLAIESLQHAVDAGWRIPWYTERDPNLVSLRSDPAFSVLIERMRADVDDMRQQLAANQP